MTKWEYNTASAHLGTLGEMGKDGWELVAIVNGVAYFKRPVDGRKTVK